MKKFIILPMFALCAMAANAQDFDSKPTVTIDNEQEDLHFTVGARFMADAAWYHNDYTPMQSGATIADARIRTSLTYQDWYFYADFGFGGGKFSQKNIFLRYNQKDNKGGNHDIQVGYYNNAAGSMARNTSLGSYHFISRAGAANALGEGRELGITYKFTNDKFMAYQGVTTENQYNKIESGFNGIVLSGRYQYRPINDGTQTLMIGGNIRYQHVGGGVTENNVLKKTIKLGQSTSSTLVPRPSITTTSSSFVVSISTSTSPRSATPRRSSTQATTTLILGVPSMLGSRLTRFVPTTSTVDTLRQAT